MAKRTRTAVLHTRFATQGRADRNVNNHPIVTGGIYGVHNGCLDNDYELFRDMGLTDRRLGWVDSEAVFAALAYGFEQKEDGEPRLPVSSVEQVLELIQGSAAIGWLDAKDRADTLHIARLTGSPLEVAITKNGSTLFASTLPAIEDACDSAGMEIVWNASCEQGTYLSFTDGAIQCASEFKPAGYAPRTYTTPSSSYGYTSLRRTPGWTAKDDDVWVDLTDDDYIWPSGKAHSRDEVDAATGEIIERIDETLAECEDDPIVAKYNTPLIDGIYLNHDHCITQRPETRERQNAIDNWLSGMSNQDMDHIHQLWYQLGADIKVGDWCETDVLGRPYMGQVAELPDSFPDGAYILRVILPNTERKLGSEIVFLTRNYDQFDVVLQKDEPTERLALPVASG